MRPDIVIEARDWIGTPYLHQGSHKGVGTDCLGLILGVWRALGGQIPVEVPAYGMSWSATDSAGDLRSVLGAHLDAPAPDAPTAGDILLFQMRQAGPARHLGIDTGQGSFIHAYSRHAVLESPLSTPWARRVVARFAFPRLKKD